jgi:predicted ATPase/class 3 adenylate cyclase
MELPSGTVTFLFTDIQGSTQLWQLHPSVMPLALARHHALLRQAIEAHRGYIFQIIGDAFCAAFHTARDGLEAAITAQLSLAAEDWREIGSLTVRMALHSGDAELNLGDKISGEYASGMSLNRAARLLSAGHGGQVLLSQAVYDLLVYDLPIGVELRDLGKHRLKDLQHPEHIFQLIAVGLPETFPPLKTLEVVPNNLPIQLTSFIGREKEIGDIKQLLIPGGSGPSRFKSARLITLVGPGGTGKTRLSLQVGNELLDSFPDGVWLVEFGPLNDSTLILQTVAAAVGVLEKSNQDLKATLIEVLIQRISLLIFDNCEHLVEACAQLALDLLRSCANLSIIASSRESLDVPGEVIYAVPALSLPEESDLDLGIDAFMRFASFRLFVDRAQVAQPQFKLTPENALPINQICRQLDGIPLAIEMAAARTKMLSPAQIAARLKDRFRLLTGGGRFVPARQQTLQALIDWSYDLLHAPEKMLFRRLAVFAGDFTLEAVEEVCSDRSTEMAESGPSFHRSEDIFELLNQLVNKSLVVVSYDQSGENRFKLLETIRQYAKDKLVSAGELDVFQARHAQYFLNRGLLASPYLEEADQVVWLDILDKDLDNLRAALSWSCHPDRYSTGLRLADALKIYWYTRGFFSEGRDWLGRLLPFAINRNQLRANALDQIGFFARYQCDFQAAESYISESLDIWRGLCDEKGIADCLTNLGYVLLFKGNLESSLKLYQESLEINQRLDNQQGIADALSHLGMIAFYRGNLEQAQAYHSESLAIWQKIHDQIGVSHALNRLASVAFQAGLIEKAYQIALESLRIARDLKFSEGIAWSIEIISAYAVHYHKVEEAVYLESLYKGFRHAIGLPASPAQQKLLEEWLSPAYENLSSEVIKHIQVEAHKIPIDQVVATLLEGSFPRISE